MQNDPTVSIIVNNYNYGRFLAAAIRSALAQTWPACEVIVVDDGSTDESRSVIESFGEQIKPILQANAGQAAALNAGFAACTGEIVIFLDADDILLPDVAERYVAAFRTEPDAAKIMVQMAVVDAAGRPTGERKPAGHLAMPAGDLSRELVRFAADVPWLPTSGNAFRAAVLWQIMPIPVEDYGRICADWYLAQVAPLYGLVVFLPVVGALYRVHGGNNHEVAGAEINLQQLSHTIYYAEVTQQHVRARARSLGLPAGGRQEAVATLGGRMILLRLAPKQSDGRRGHGGLSCRLSLAWRGILASLGRTDATIKQRLLFICWFAAMALAPRRGAEWLAAMFLYPQRRPAVPRFGRRAGETGGTVEVGEAGEYAGMAGKDGEVHDYEGWSQGTPGLRHRLLLLCLVLLLGWAALRQISIASSAEAQTIAKAPAPAAAPAAPDAPPVAAAALPAPTVTLVDNVVPAQKKSIYWGALVSGRTYGRSDAPWDIKTLEKFEEHAGKRVSILHWGQAWWTCGKKCSYQDFSHQQPQFEAMRKRGVIPFVDWASWRSDANPVTDQPDFSLKAILDGKHDDYIQRWAKQAKAWGHPFFLRFNWEMNGDWFPWSEKVNGNKAGQYVKAWRHVHDLFAEAGADNVTWVWCPNVIYSGSIKLDSLYPGDDYVDWTCMDGYNWGEHPARHESWKSFDEVFGATYAELLKIAPGKPIIIGETASTGVGGSKVEWIHEALTDALPNKFPAVEAILWFNWDTDQMDWTIESSDKNRAAFAEAIASDYFVAGGEGLLVGSPIQPHEQAGMLCVVAVFLFWPKRAQQRGG